MTSRIEHAVTLWEPTPSWFTRAATLIHDTTNPHSVTLRFDNAGARTPEPDVTFDRQHLADATEHGHASGDEVRIEPEAYPERPEWDTQWLTLTLRPGRPDAVELLLNRQAAATLLTETYAVVPLCPELVQLLGDAR